MDDIDPAVGGDLAVECECAGPGEWAGLPRRVGGGWLDEQRARGGEIDAAVAIIVGGEDLGHPRNRRDSSLLEHAAGTLLLRVRIKEREFSSDLRTRRAATVEIEAYTEPPAAGGPAAMALYSETTAQSLRSYAYLSGLLQLALRLLER